MAHQSSAETETEVGKRVCAACSPAGSTLEWSTPWMLDSPRTRCFLLIQVIVY